MTILRIRISDIREHLSSFGFSNRPAYGLISIFFRRKLQQFNLQFQKTFLCGQIKHPGIKHKIFTFYIGHEAVIEFWD